MKPLEEAHMGTAVGRKLPAEPEPALLIILVIAILTMLMIPINIRTKKNTK